MNRKALVGAVAAFVMFTAAAAAAETIGAGSTFVYPILYKWSSSYQSVAGKYINYQSIGSRGGIAQIKAKAVTFGMTDKPLMTTDLNEAGLIQFPVVIGGIVPVVNVPGVKAGQLVLDGPTLANIYLGKIKSWSDPAIMKLNPGVNLPSSDIGTVHRSDGSGTTFNFTTYLARVSAEWKSSVGADTAIDWPIGTGGKGNEGVADNVQKLAGTIGYVEYAYAKQNHLAYVKMVNHAGKTVEPDVDSFRAAATNANWVGAAKNDFYVLFLDSPGQNAWPIAATTFALVYKNPPDKVATADVLKFFQWSFEKGDQEALSLDYVPLPNNAVKAIEASWKQVQGSGM